MAKPNAYSLDLELDAPPRRKQGYDLGPILLRSKDTINEADERRFLIGTLSLKNNFWDKKKK